MNTLHNIKSGRFTSPFSQQNFLERYSGKLQGVPSFKYRGIHVFGHNKINRIEMMICEHFENKMIPKTADLPSEKEAFIETHVSLERGWLELRLAI